MKIVAISDTHGYHDAVKLPEADLLLHAGDWSRHGRLEDTIDFLRWFQSQSHLCKVFIAGNHDWYTEKEPVMFGQLLAEFAPSCVYLEDSHVMVDGLKIHGSAVTPRFLDWAWNRDRGPAIRKHWDLIPDDTDILLTHGPAAGFRDYMRNEELGCQDLRDALKRVRPTIHICGHLHFGQGVGEFVYEDGGKTRLYNAAICTEAYRPTNQPHLIEL